MPDDASIGVRMILRGSMQISFMHFGLGYAALLLWCYCTPISMCTVSILAFPSDVYDCAWCTIFAYSQLSLYVLNSMMESDCITTVLLYDHCVDIFRLCYCTTMDKMLLYDRLLKWLMYDDSMTYGHSWCDVMRIYEDMMMNTGVCVITAFIVGDSLAGSPIGCLGR